MVQAKEVLRVIRGLDVSQTGEVGTERAFDSRWLIAGDVINVDRIARERLQIVPKRPRPRHLLLVFRRIEPLRDDVDIPLVSAVPKRGVGARIWREVSRG